IRFCDAVREHLTHRFQPSTAPRTVYEYVTEKERTSAHHAPIDLLEMALGSELPNSVVHDPVFHTLRKLGARAATLIEELTAPSADSEDHELVQLIAKERGIEPKRARQTVVALANAYLHAFTRLAGLIISGEPERVKTLERHVAGMQDVLRGQL